MTFVANPVWDRVMSLIVLQMLEPLPNVASGVVCVCAIYIDGTKSVKPNIKLLIYLIKYSHLLPLGW